MTPPMLEVVREHTLIESSIRIVNLTRTFILVADDVTTKSRAVSVRDVEFASHLVAVEEAIVDHAL